MIITKTPLRISFIGGGTDLPSFSNRYCGRVVSTTINKYIYISLKEHCKVFNEKYRLNYFKTEITNSIENIENNIIREALKFLNITQNIYISTIADFPSRSGLGSSSSFAVGLLHALHIFKNQKISLPQLADEACNLEIKILGNPIGKQDQHAAGIGGFNAFTFRTDGKISIQPIILKEDRLNYLFDNLMLFWTGLNRDANKVLKEQKKNINKKFKILKQMSDNANKFKKLISNGFTIEEVGNMLHENWLLKKQLASKISNSFIDKKYQIALNNGASGGKITGAGNGGCLLLVVKKENKEKVRVALKDLIEIKINYEPEGSKVL